VPVYTVALTGIHCI